MNINYHSQDSNYLVAMLSCFYGVEARKQRGKHVHPNELKYNDKLSILARINPEMAERVDRELRRKYGLPAKQRPQTKVPNCPSVSKLEREVSGMENQRHDLSNVSWKKARYIAFVVYGNRCMCCGTDAKNAMMTVDHIIARSVDSSKRTDVRNLQILCEDCNVGKDNWDTTDWRTPEQRADMLTVFNQPSTITFFMQKRSQAQ